MDRFNGNSENYSQYENWAAMIASSVMRKYNLCKTKRDDYKSAARLGLAEAFSRFDSEKSDCFEKYAYRRVKGAVIDAVRCDSLLSQSAYKHSAKLRCKDLESKIEVKINTDGNYIQGCTKGLLVYQSEFLEDQSTEITFDKTPEKEYELKEIKNRLLTKLKLLSAEEQEVIIEHYYNEKSLSQIAIEKGGRSRSWASRIHLRALSALKELCFELDLKN